MIIKFCPKCGSSVTFKIPEGEMLAKKLVILDFYNWSDFLNL